MNTNEKILKEFREKFIRGVAPMSLPNGTIQDADSWVEADIEELEEFIYASLDQVREQTERKVAQDILESLSVGGCGVCVLNSVIIEDKMEKYFKEFKREALTKLKGETTK